MTDGSTVGVIVSVGVLLAVAVFVTGNDGSTVMVGLGLIVGVRVIVGNTLAGKAFGCGCAAPQEAMKTVSRKKSCILGRHTRMPPL